MYSQYRDGRQPTKIPKLKLKYFNLTGRGETIRFILAVGDIPYEDVRIKFEDWPALKPKTLFGFLPELEVDGVAMGQSGAIQRYVAHLAGLTGRDSSECALVDSVADCVTDIREAVFRVAFLPEDVKAEKLKKLSEETIPDLLDTIAQFRATHGGKFLVGDKVTWADLHFAASLEAVNDNAYKVDLKKSGLQDLYDNVMSLPNLANYIKNRPS